ncbi:TPA: ABC transporter ATP-binding protein [Candidatus Geothermarchaeota archaeon]|nr:ABC transporter ATP-binding protein [Candidatus Geothermarchaeota archaeon]
MSREIVKTVGLKKYFRVTKSFIERLFEKSVRYVKAVDGVDITIYRGEVISLVGESGSGKTTFGKLTLRLIDPTEGKIFFKGVEITNLKGEELRRLRRDMQVIYQDPYSSLNPRMKIGDIIGEPLEIHGLMDKNEIEEAVLNMLERVGLTPPQKFYSLYPRDLSGGQRQRVAIARTMIMNPSFIVADEPVSMIDLSLRASILDLMMDLKREYNLTILFITHDLSTAYYLSDRIAIMYLGRLVEIGDRDKIFKNPLHPYTQALLKAIPIPKPKYRVEIPLKGEIPNAINIPSGCRFHPRCPYIMDICRVEDPKLIEVEKNHYVACHLY